MFIDHRNDIYNSIELQSAAIAAQNDLFRNSIADPMQSARRGIEGTRRMSQAIAARGPEFQAKVIQAVADFDGFTSDNDPWGERGYGTVTVEGQAIFWSIDLFDEEFEEASALPWSPDHTLRLLRIEMATQH